MVVYEVNLEVDIDIAGEYAAWLRGHIRQLLAIDGFVRATWLENHDDAFEKTKWVVHYYLKDRASLEAYFEHHAEAMRREGLERFPGRFTASRRVLDVVEEFAA